MTRLLLTLAATTALALPIAARGQSALGPQLQNATIRGHGDTLIIKRLPVRTLDGVVYRDITIELQVAPNGDVVANAHGVAPAAAAHVTAEHDITVGQVTETEAPAEVAAHFIPGLYRDDVSGGLMHLFSSGKKLFGSFPNWSFSVLSGDTVIGGASWYGGPIRSNPYKSLIDHANITNDAYSYGVMESAGGGNFDQGMLIGAQEVGDKLTVVSFHVRGCCVYSDQPTSMITYTRVGN